MPLPSPSALECIAQARDVKLSTRTKGSHSIVVPWATYSPWADDLAFDDLYRVIQPNTLVDIYRAYELWSLVQQTAHLGGDILEVGVWRGGTGCLLAYRAKQLQPAARVLLCDTFKGVVKAGCEDSFYRGGEHADTSVDLVQELTGKLGITNVELLQGIFPDETGAAIEDSRFSLCHIDVDVYASAKQISEWVWPRLLPGGVMVYDDYGFSTCEGVTKLVNEHLQGHAALTLHNLNGHAVVVKRF